MSTVYQAIELSMELDSKHFQKILATIADRENQLREHDEGYVDEALSSKGLTVFFRNSQYKKKIRIGVNPYKILKNTSDTDKLIHKLRKRIEEYFEEKYNLNDFIVTGTCLYADADVGNRQDVSFYLNTLHRIGKVKGFSPSKSVCYDEDRSLLWEGNSNAVDILLYDLEHAAVSHNRDDEKHLKGELRTEVHLTKPKAIREYVDAVCPSGQIAELWEKRNNIFMKTVMQVIPYGDFYKIGAAEKIIYEKVSDSAMRRKMLLLLSLVPQKKSLLLAQKAMKTRDIERIMDSCAKISLSPVTIGKRQNAKHLKNLYNYFL